MVVWNQILHDSVKYAGALRPAPADILEKRVTSKKDDGLELVKLGRFFGEIPVKFWFKRSKTSCSNRLNLRTENNS